MFHSCTGFGAGRSRFRPNRRPARRQLVSARLGAGFGMMVSALLMTGNALAQQTLPPTLDVSTFAGGTPVESAIAATVDAGGNLVMVGRSLHLESRGFGRGYDSDVFVARYNGSRDSTSGAADLLLSVTWLGGDGWDEPTAVAVDTDGNIIITGHTTSKALVLDPEAPLDPEERDSVDGFVAVLDSEASELLSSTFVGSSADERITGVAVDSEGGIHVSGTTASMDLDGAVNEPKGGEDGFVAGLQLAAGNTLEISYLAYVGGSADDALNGIALFERSDPGLAGTVVAVAGMTESSGESLRAGFGHDVVDGERRGLRDALIAMLEIDPNLPDPVKPVQVSVYGGSSDETANAIAVDAQTGDMFVVGRVVDMEGQVAEDRRSDSYEPLPTWLPDAESPLRVSAGVQHAFQGGDSDGFVLRLVRHLQDDGSEVWSRWLSSYLGGDGDDNLTSVAFDGEFIHVAGATRSSACDQSGNPPECDTDSEGGVLGLPVINALYAKRGAADGISPRDGYYARIHQPHREGQFDLASQIEIVTATYLGGAGTDDINSIVATADSVWLVGQTALPVRRSSPRKEWDHFPIRRKTAQSGNGTNTEDFPQQGIGLDADAFAARLSAVATTPAARALGLEFSTYVGGNGFLTPTASAVDTAGNLVVVGYAMIPQGNLLIAHRDGFIARYDAAGREMLGFKWLGGAGWDVATAVAVDGAGDIVVAGYTTGKDVNLYDDPARGRSEVSEDRKGFFVIVDAALTDIKGGEFIGGSGEEELTGVAIDSSGCIHLSGTTTSDDLATLNAMYDMRRGGQDGFVAGYCPGADRSWEPLYLTYLGGDRDDALTAITVLERDYPQAGVREGRLIAVAGITTSTNPILESDTNFIKNHEEGDLKGKRDALIAVLRVFPDGNDRVQGVQSWKYGSSFDEIANAIAVDAATDDLFVVGRVLDTESQWPAAQGAPDYVPLPSEYATLDISIQNSYQGGTSDGFLLRLRRMSYSIGDRETPIAAWLPSLSTYVGGVGADNLTAVAFDGTWIHVAGYSAPDDQGSFAGLPVVNALQPQPGQDGNGNHTMDGYYARIGHHEQYEPKAGDPDAAWFTHREVETATYLGGGGREAIRDVVVTNDGAVWLAGWTDSGNAGTGTGFPLVNPIVSDLQASPDGFVARLTGTGDDDAD